MQYATHYPRYGGTLRWIADVTDPALVAKILEHVRSKPPPCAGPARTATTHDFSTAIA